MNNTTKSFDDAVYKLVTRARSGLVGFDAKELSTIEKFLDCFPADLPGVVTHSGEPAGHFIKTKYPDGSHRISQLPQGVHESRYQDAFPLFTHADPAEVEQLRQLVAEAIGTNKREKYTGWDSGWQHDIKDKLLYFQNVSTCTCLKKAPEVKSHTGRCLYRVLFDALSYIESLEAQLAQQDGAQPVAFLRENLRIELNPLVKFDYPAGTAAAIKIPLYTHPATQPATDAPTRNCAANAGS